jgi:D-alanyl-D-alanine carboxypeptidase
MRAMQTAILGFVLLFSGPVESASPISTDSQKAIARQASAILGQVTTEGGPGAAILIAQGDAILFRGARGSANIELGVPLVPDQVFRIASVTKMFTAALVLKLVENGKLSLDDPLARTLPDFPNAGSITIRQLLSHTAGLSDKSLLGNEQPGFLRRDIELSSLVQVIGKEPLRFAPGSMQAYSNAGYIVLGAVIEKVSGKPWFEAMREQLLDPVGLTHTRFDAANAILSRRVAGYTKGLDGQVANADFISVSVPSSAGGLVSTIDDLHRWMRALSTGRAINPASFRMMQTPAVLPEGPAANPYGFGLYVWTMRGESVVGHTGQIDGFASFLAYIPSRDVTIVVLGNDDTFDAQTAGRKLTAIALGRPYTVVSAVPLSDELLRSLAGQYRIGTQTMKLSVREGAIYYQRNAGKQISLQMSGNGELHFMPDELSYFIPVLDNTGHVTQLNYWRQGEGPPVIYQKIL